MKALIPFALMLVMAACGGKKQDDGVRSPYLFDKLRFDKMVKEGTAIYNAEKTPDGKLADEQYYLGDTVKYELRYSKDGKLDFVLKRGQDGTFEWQEFYYPSGQRKAHYAMKAIEGTGSKTGVYHGLFEKFHENGNLQSKGEYQADKISWKIEFDQTGKPGDTILYERVDPKK